MLAYRVHVAEVWKKQDSVSWRGVSVGHLGLLVGWCADMANQRLLSKYSNPASTALRYSSVRVLGQTRDGLECQEGSRYDADSACSD